jgi:glutathione S-transferase
LDIAIEEVGIPKSSALQPEYLVASPHRLVPALELDNGTRIGEAMAICRYLEALHPEPPLMGRDPEEAALIDMWERRAELEGMRGVVEMFRNANPGFVDRGLAGWTTPVPQIEQLVTRGQARVERFFGILEDRLGETEFLGGAAFSVADITALCTVDFAKRAAKSEIPPDATNLLRWYEAVSSRPSAAA